MLQMAGLCMMFGFVLGYGVRAGISYYRHAEARRRRAY